MVNPPSATYWDFSSVYQQPQHHPHPAPSPPRPPPHNFCFGCLFLLLFSVSAYNGLNPSEVSLVKADLIDLVMRTEAGQTEKKGSPDIKISEPGDGWEEGEAGILGLTYMYYYT